MIEAFFWAIVCLFMIFAICICINTLIFILSFDMGFLEALEQAVKDFFTGYNS